MQKNEQASLGEVEELNKIISTLQKEIKILKQDFIWTRRLSFIYLFIIASLATLTSTFLTIFNKEFIISNQEAKILYSCLVFSSFLLPIYTFLIKYPSNRKGDFRIFLEIVISFIISVIVLGVGVLLL